MKKFHENGFGCGTGKYFDWLNRLHKLREEYANKCKALPPIVSFSNKYLSVTEIYGKLEVLGLGWAMQQGRDDKDTRENLVFIKKYLSVDGYNGSCGTDLYQ